MTKPKKTKVNFFGLPQIFVALLFLAFFYDTYQRSQGIQELRYDEFLSYLDQGKVDEVVISAQKLTGRLKEGASEKGLTFRTIPVEESLVTRLEKGQVKFRREPSSDFLRELLSWILPVILLGAFWLFLLKRMGQKGGFGNSFMTVGKSRAKIYMQTEVKTTFSDVAGLSEAISEIKEVVEFLKSPDQFSTLGAKMPHGILLVGPPGTGKTLLAKAVAGEAQVPFFHMSGSEFVELFVGVGAARVRDLFAKAREKSPCIIFIDELDAMGRTRSGPNQSGGQDEKEQTLNQLLVELDGFDSHSGVILLAATNRPEILDKALLRAGRFDRQILVDRPDKKGREAILRLHVKRIKLSEGTDLETIASMTVGFTGADLANLVNEATLVATRRKAKAVEREDFENAFERIIAGLEKKNRILVEKERKIIATHEMGHAIVTYFLHGPDSIHKISIIPHGVAALGYTLGRPTEDRYLMTQDELKDKMAILMGGRAAEALCFERVSTGAQDDLAKATQIARSMVTQFGMDPKLGSVAYETPQSKYLGYEGLLAKVYSEQTAHEIDRAIRDLIQNAFKKAYEILALHQNLVQKGAEQLMAQEVLDTKQIAQLFASELPHLPKERKIDLTNQQSAD